MRIGGRDIGAGQEPYVIAEIGVNHDGDVSRALELTDAAAEAGADAVKLQYFETDRLMSRAAKLAAYQKAAGETDPVEMLRRLELGLDEMARVVDRAHERGIHAIVTVFSVELVEGAAELAWDAFKSASPDVVNRPLLEALAATGRPLIVSTGASTLEEVHRTVGWLSNHREQLALLQCVSCYPAPESAIGGVLALQEEFGDLGVSVGYSSHVYTLGEVCHAHEFGAAITEAHLTYDKTASGPDHAASLTIPEFESFVGDLKYDGWRYRYFLERGLTQRSLVTVPSREMLAAIGQPIEKRVLDCERDVREVSRQSVVTTRQLAPGDVIGRADLTIKRPGTGVEPWRIGGVVGQRVARAVEADVPLTDEDLDEQKKG